MLLAITEAMGLNRKQYSTRLRTAWLTRIGAPYFLVRPFEARGLVHAIAEHRVISRDPPNPHIAHDCIAQMYETDGEWRQALGFELTIERFAPRLGEKGPATCSFDIVGLQMGRVSCQAAEGTRSLQAVPSVSGPILN